MALFESYERRVDKINAVLAEYGISSIEECKEITLAKGIDCDKIVRETQPICFENAAGSPSTTSSRPASRTTRRRPRASRVRAGGIWRDISARRCACRTS